MAKTSSPRHTAPLFQCLDADHKTAKDLNPFIVTRFTFLFVTTGSGGLIIDNVSHPVASQACFLLHPDTLIEWRLTDTSPVYFYNITFNSLNPPDNLPDLPKGALYTSHMGRLADLAEKLVWKSREEQDPYLKKLIQHSLLYELIYLLCQGSRQGADSHHKTKNRINSAREYMHSHYREDITREMLAHIAGLSPGHFSVVFKKETGQGPIDYLNQIRIDKAKHLLISTNSRLKTIARQIGYKDEFYFSRIFKKTTGSAPTVYIKKKHYKIANLVCPFNGHFHVLDYNPYITLDYLPYAGYLMSTKDRSFTFRTDRGFEDVLRPALQKLTDLKPDMIVGIDLFGDYEALLGKIAPTMAIPWMGCDWRDHLRHIADLLRKREEAENWLDTYDTKAASAADTLKQYILPRDRTMIVRIYGGKYSIYGKRNIGHVLYNDLKLKPVDSVYHIPKNDNQLQFSLEQLVEQKADHLFVMTSRDHQSAQMLTRLVQHEKFLRMPAVVKKQVYHIDEPTWLGYSASTHELLLDKVVNLFRLNYDNPDIQT